MQELILVDRRVDKISHPAGFFLSLVSWHNLTQNATGCPVDVLSHVSQLRTAVGCARTYTGSSGGGCVEW